MGRNSTDLTLIARRASAALGREEYDRTVSICQEGLAVAGEGDAPERDGLLSDLGTALLSLTRYGEAEAPLRRAIVGFERRRDFLGAARAYNSLARLLQSRGEAEGALSILDLAISSLADRPVAVLAMLHRSRARVLWNAALFDQCLGAALVAEDIARRYGDTGVMAEARMQAARCLGVLGRAREAGRLLDDVLGLTRSLPPCGRSGVLGNASAAALVLGRLEEATQFAREGLRAAQECRNRERIVAVTVAMAEIEGARGRPDEAWERYLDARRAAAQLEGKIFLANALIDSGVFAVQQAWWERVDDALREIDSLPPEILRAGGVHIHRTLLLAHTAFARGNGDDLFRWANECIQASRQGNELSHVADCLLLQGEWLHEHGPAGEAVPILTEALEICQKLNRGSDAERIAKLLGPGPANRGISLGTSEQRLDIQSPVAESLPMRTVLSLVERLAPLDVPVVIEGETGTGKGYVARLLHRLSRRARGPFVEIHCAAIPETLLETELFGHVRGTFTGALTDRRGRIESADGGTLFLDDLADMTPRLQASLLRAVQFKEVQRVGSEEVLRVDVRIVAASRQELRQLVAEGRFRADLFYRLGAFTLSLPPLRERREDIPELTRNLLLRYGEERGRPVEADPEVLEILSRYPFPGNIRELENLLRRAAIFLEGARVRATDLPDRVREEAARAVPNASAVVQNDLQFTWLREAQTRLEQSFLERLLRSSGGRLREAARISGMHVTDLRRRLLRHGIPLRVSPRS